MEEEVEQPERPSGGPIFIVGAMGSGTTLMRLVLDSHPNIAIPLETGFMRAVVANKFIPFWRFGGQWYGRLGLSEEEFDARLRDFYGGIFEQFAQQKGKRRWGDKTPYHTWQLPEAARVFPDAVFIAMLRHPGGVLSSLRSRFGFTWEMGVKHWKESTLELVHQAGELGDRFALCRYEDLVLEPESTLRELLAWLGEPWSPRVLEHHVIQEEQGNPTKVEGRTLSTDPIDAARVSKWKDSLDADGRRLLRRRTTSLARFFGYDLVTPTAFEPLLPSTSERQKVMLGGEVQRRQLAFSDVVDWASRPEPPYADQKLKPGKFKVVRKPEQKRQARSESAQNVQQANRVGPQAVRRRSRRRHQRPVPYRIARAVLRCLPAPARAWARRLLQGRTAAAGSR